MTVSSDPEASDPPPPKDFFTASGSQPKAMSMSTSRGGSPDDSVGSVGYEAEPTERGERLIWLEAAMADRLGAMREAGERQANRNCCRFEGRRSRPLPSR
jgi:hypothetical protein